MSSHKPFDLTSAAANYLVRRLIEKESIQRELYGLSAWSDFSVARLRKWLTDPPDPVLSVEEANALIFIARITAPSKPNP